MSSAAVTAETTAAVVFDFGGVVFNWRPVDLIQSLLPHLANTPEAAADLAQRVFQSFVPGSDWSEFDRGALHADEVTARIAVRTGLPQDDLFALLEAIPAHLAPVPGTVDWLNRLADAGVRLHFLSNMPRPYAEYLLREHAFLARFQSGVFSCEVGQVKPHAAIFETATQRFGLPPQHCVFIDDHPSNVEVARQLGWRAVQFVDAPQCEQALQERGWLPST